MLKRSSSGLAPDKPAVFLTPTPHSQNFHFLWRMLPQVRHQRSAFRSYRLNCHRVELVFVAVFLIAVFLLCNPQRFVELLCVVFANIVQHATRDDDGGYDIKLVVSFEAQRAPSALLAAKSALHWVSLDRNNVVVPLLRITELPSRDVRLIDA